MSKKKVVESKPTKDDTDTVKYIKSAYLTWTVGQLLGARYPLAEFMAMTPSEIVKACKKISLSGQSLYDIITKNN